jgi:hypothetical protein
MTPFDFPDAPTLDQEVTVDGTTFIWTPSPDRWRRAGVVVPPGTPILTALVPRVGLVNNAAIAVTLQGVGFTINSVVKFGATVAPSVFVSSTELTVTAPLSAVVATAMVTVSNDVLISNALPFNYILPMTLTVLTPVSSPINASTGVVVTGTNFTAACVVQFDGVGVVTTFINATTLNCTAPASATVKVSQVVVRNDVIATAALPFNYTTVPVLQLLQLVPNTCMAGESGMRVNLYGAEFTPSSRVYWNGAEWLYKSFISSEHIELYNLDMPVVATIPVLVQQGTTTTPPLNFNVATAVGLTLTEFVPVSSLQGTPPFLLRYIGTGYRNSSIVTFNNATVPAVFISSTEMHATVTPSAVGGATSAVCKVQNGMEVSNSRDFPMINPAQGPTLTSLNPTALTLSGGTGGPYPVQAYGTNFQNGPPTVRVFNSTHSINALVQAVHSPTHLTFVLPIAALPPGVSYSVTVTINNMTSNPMSLFLEWN